jgi:hypothetical protein
MNQQFLIALAALAVSTGAGASAAVAKSAWQDPVVKSCVLAPSADCNVEAQCPANMPYVVSGGGGMPSAEPTDHAVAMTMNLPVAQDTWRVRWRNLSGDEAAKVKVAVRIRCSDTAAEAGW